MAHSKPDPLLMAAKVIVALGMGLTIFAATMMAIGAGAVLTVGRGELVAELAKVDAPPGAFWAILGALLLIAAILAMAVWFLKTLYGIIRSVDRGDPFDPANAGRLSLMGWLTVAIQLATVPLGAIAVWLSQSIAEIGEGMRGQFDFGGGGIVLTLVLFILARVFRKGAEMRADLEGTV